MLPLATEPKPEEDVLRESSVFLVHFSSFSYLNARCIASSSFHTRRRQAEFIALKLNPSKTFAVGAVHKVRNADLGEFQAATHALTVWYRESFRGN